MEAVAAVAAQDVQRGRYLENLEALYATDPRLAARLEAIAFAQLPALEPTRDGLWTATVAADDGARLLLHSRYRPREEACRLVEQLDLEQGGHTFYVAGCGLGYVLAALEERFHRPVLLVVEDDLVLLKAALACVDLATPLREGRVFFLASTSKADLHDKLRRCNADLLLGTRFVTSPHVDRRHASFQVELRARFNEFLGFARLQMVSLLRNARVTQRNVFNNLPTYLRSPGVGDLRNLAAGYPAIVLAAGPSLARHLPEIIKLRDRAVLIATQTVFKLLLDLDCPPHFVTSLDYHEVSAEFFRGLPDTRGSVLVAEPKASWHVLDAYRGPKRVLHNRAFDLLLGNACPQRGDLPAGSTVAHLAFYLAVHLGCDPILLIGQDLCFSDGLYYPPGMPVEQIWQPELGRFCTLEMKQWERIARQRPIFRKVRDVNGREVYSDETLTSYAEQFEADFINTTARVLHCGGAGMRLRGAQVVELSNAAAEHCTRPLPEALRSRLSSAQPSDTADRLDAARTALDVRLADLARVKAIAEEMHGLLTTLEGLVREPARFNALIVRVDDLRNEITRYDTMYRLVVDVAQSAELRRYQADRELDRLKDADAAERARAQLARDRAFVEAFLDGCAFLGTTLPEVAGRLAEEPA